MTPYFTLSDGDKVTTVKLTISDVVRDIIEYYGRLRLLSRGDLTDSSLNPLFNKTTTICQTIEAIQSL